MAAGRSESPRVPAAIERFVKQLVVTLKAVLLYPPASSIPLENAEAAVKMLSAILQDRAEVRFTVQKDALLYDGNTVYKGQAAFEAFAQELYNRGLAELRFHAGVSTKHITAFLGILNQPIDELASSGGFENRLWDLGVDSITVKEAATRIVDAALLDEDLESEEQWPPEPARIDDIVAAALGGRPRDQRLLVRVAGDSKAVTRYLKETLSGRGVDPTEALRQLKIGDLARAVSRSTDPAQRADLFNSISKAIADLDPELRRSLLTERLLPEARGDENIASIVRHMDIDDVCHWLVDGTEADQVSVDGLARAIRNLALISLAERDTVLNAAGAAMRAAGLAEESVGDVLEMVSPSRLEVRDRPEHAPSEEQPVESIMQLVNLAPGSVARRFDDDPDFLALQEESRRGINDGDVVRSLVTLVNVDAGGTNFGSMMALLEDTLELTVERGDFDVAADVAEALRSAAGNPDLPRERTERIEQALAKLSGTRQLTLVTKAMRVYPEGSVEHRACSQFLGALGTAALDPLLDVLANEPDMTARKALVDIISSMSGDLIDELGARVSDPRWFFARNVVAILGRTKRPEILNYLNRTLRHNDARVRRETIRALASVRDRLAIEMLIAALDDSDAQNVQLAARYIGASQELSAVGALASVAHGEGRGNRETGPRVEAIEALGRLGSKEALPVLEEIVGKRALMRAARVRELRTAAEHAIAAITSAQGGAQL